MTEIRVLTMSLCSRALLACLALACALSSACVSYSTDSTEVGVRTKKMFGAGIEQHVYPPGATYFFMPFLSDWATFDIKLQTLDMIRDPSRGDRQGDDSVQFKTTDGNDISVNVTVSWRIDPQMAPQILTRVGRSIKDVKERLVRPACRTYVRDVLNELHSEEFYISDKRFEKASTAMKRLQEELSPEGIVIEQVLFGEHRFHPDYEKVIHDRKIAEQNAERLKSEAQAAEAEAKRNLEKARGDVQVAVAQAKGQAQRMEIAANSKYYQNQRDATAILTERTARAKGVQKQNQAMAGVGGRTMVKLRLAEALQGKPILVVPAGSGANLQKLDINRLIESVQGIEATAAAQEGADQPAPQSK